MPRAIDFWWRSDAPLAGALGDVDEARMLPRAAAAFFREPRWRPEGPRLSDDRPPTPAARDPWSEPRFREPRWRPPAMEPRREARPPGPPGRDPDAPPPPPAFREPRPDMDMDPRPCSVDGAGGANFCAESASPGISSMRLKGRRLRFRFAVSLPNQLLCVEIVRASASQPAGSPPLGAPPPDACDASSSLAAVAADAWPATGAVGPSPTVRDSMDGDVAMLRSSAMRPGWTWAGKG